MIGKTNALMAGRKPEQTKTVEFNPGSANNITITPDAGYVLSSAQVNKPATMIPENIKNGIDIGGVTGTYTGSGGSGSLAWVELDYTGCSFNNESIFLSPEVSKLIDDELKLSGERMIIIRFVATYLNDDFGDLPVKIMIAFSKTIRIPAYDSYNIGGGAVIRGFSTSGISDPYDATLDTTNGTSIKFPELSAPSDFSNPNIISLDYVAIDI